jgi:hypothetical protein
MSRNMLPVLQINNKLFVVFRLNIIIFYLITVSIFEPVSEY